MVKVTRKDMVAETTMAKNPIRMFNDIIIFYNFLFIFSVTMMMIMVIQKIQIIKG